MKDFRNSEPDEIIKILKKNQFNEVKINNFFNSFNNQMIENILELKGVKNLKEISGSIQVKPLKLVKTLKDDKKNEKFIFKTYDDYYIESVLMPDKKNISICVSVQIGCKLGCRICQTAQIGFRRNLFANEILDQIKIIYLERIKPLRISCISIMGMGEPFDNLDNTMTAINWISSNWGFKISRKKITLSTSGCIKFDNFFKYKKLPNLAVSLHSAVEKKRNYLLPASKFSLNELKKQMLKYCELTKKQISLEYCLIKDFNDKKEDADELLNYIKDLPGKINLINYNKTTNGKFEGVSESVILDFLSHLKKNNIPVIYRKSLGIKIGAGCGQLGHSYIEKSGNNNVV